MTTTTTPTPAPAPTSPAELHRTLGDLVAENASRAIVLERFGIDYCCHGDRTLAAALDAAGLDPSDVVTELRRTPDAASVAVGDDPAALAGDIEATHHTYLHTELPEVEALAAKVAGVHRLRHPELDLVHQLVVALRADLTPHLEREERDLFPAVQAGAGGSDLVPLIERLRVEHDAAGGLLERLRKVTGNYTTPADGCASYASLYSRLAALEADTHLHIHKENNVLFPRIEGRERPARSC